MSNEGLSAEDMAAESATALPDKEVVSILDLNADLDLAIDAAAPIDLAVAAEELGADGAFFRVHHFARQLAAPFPLLAAVGARTRRIEIGTAVIDMRYENPMYMAEDAGAADLMALNALLRPEGSG